MNAVTATPARVTRVKASHPLMQDEDSGRDGRRYNEWFASRLDARLRARESAKRIADEIAAQYDESDDRSAHGNLPMGIAAAMPFLGAFLGVCCLALAAIIF